MKDDELTIFRRRNIGFVYLVPVLNVEENILLPIQLLSLILLNSIVSATRGFDLDEYVSRSVLGDFAVADYSLYAANASKNTAGVTSEFLSEAQRR